MPTGPNRTDLVPVAEVEVALAVEDPAGEDVAKVVDKDIPTKAKATTTGSLIPSGNRCPMLSIKSRSMPVHLRIDPNNIRPTMPTPIRLVTTLPPLLDHQLLLTLDTDRLTKPISTPTNTTTNNKPDNQLKIRPQDPCSGT